MSRRVYSGSEQPGHQDGHEAPGGADLASVAEEIVLGHFDKRRGRPGPEHRVARLGRRPQEELAPQNADLSPVPGHLPGPDERQIIFRMAADGQEAQVAAPRVADEVDTVPAEAGPQEPRQLVRVLERPADAQPGPVGRRVERLPGPPPVPMDDDEVPLQIAPEGVGEVHGRHAGSAVQEEEDGFVPVMPPDEHPLLDAAEPDLLQRRHAPGTGQAGRPAAKDRQGEDRSQDHDENDGREQGQDPAERGFHERHLDRV